MLASDVIWLDVFGLPVAAVPSLGPFVLGIRHLIRMILRFPAPIGTARCTFYCPLGTATEHFP